MTVFHTKCVPGKVVPAGRVSMGEALSWKKSKKGLSWILEKENTGKQQPGEGFPDKRFPLVRGPEGRDSQSEWVGYFWERYP